MSKSKKSGGGGTATKAPARKKRAAKEPKAAHVEVTTAEAPQEPVAPPVDAEAKPTKAKNVDKPLSCLDAAAQVLAAKGEPMRAKDIIDAVFAAKLWHSEAPTPAATLVSAILREMKKGAASRFTKAGRGLFALNGK